VPERVKPREMDGRRAIHWKQFDFAMATLTQTVALEEYLDATYRPDREYLSGEVRERNVGKWEHARVQLLLAAWFASHEAEWNVMASTEQRLRILEDKVRVPDLVVVRPGPQPDVLVKAPLLVVEILSPGDTYSETQERAEDYRSIGVETVWIIDTQTRTGRMCSGDDWTAARRLTVPATQIYVEFDPLFSFLDRPSQ
jgi:Uma2 family endonuclease